MGVNIKDIPRQVGTPVYNMKDGQIAEIVQWSYGEAIGKIVQRYGKILIVLGGEKGKAFTTVLDEIRENCRVRILPGGTTLEITNNE